MLQPRPDYFFSQPLTFFGPAEEEDDFAEIETWALMLSPPFQQHPKTGLFLFWIENLED